MKVLVVLGILVLGMISGSWYIPSSDLGIRILELGDEVDRLQSIVEMQKSKTEIELKIISYIVRYNRNMSDSLKNLVARIIVEMSKRYDNLGIDTILAVITWESARTWRPDIVSPVGAIGLMQIMPLTGIWLAGQERVDDFALVDLYNPIINIRLGCRYLSYLIGLYGSLEPALANYNGGPYQARYYLAGDIRLCEETRNYVPGILALLK